MRLIKLTPSNTRGLAPFAGFGGRLAQTDIENQLDWLFGTALAGFAGPGGDGQFPVDLYEDKDNTYVRAELPGVTRDAIGVEVADGSLSIQATRKDKTGGEETTVSLSRQIAR